MYRFTKIAFPALLLALLAHPAKVHADAKPDAAEVVRLLEELRTEIELPGLTVAEAARNLKTPAAALAFVMDEVAFMPYRGSYHGADGTLRIRVANAADKALLLQALLRAMNVEAELVRARWPADATPHRAKGRAARPAALAKLQKLLGVSGAKAGARKHASKVAELQSEVAGAMQALRLTLEAAGEGRRLEGAPTNAARALPPVDWVWVRAKLDGSSWSDLDPVFPDEARSADAVRYTARPAKATLRVLADTTPLVTWTGNTSDLLGLDAQVQLLPASDDLSVAEKPETVKQWVPGLRVGATTLLGKAFAPGGKTVAPSPAVKSLWGSTPAKPGQIGAKALRIEITFDAGEGRKPQTYGRVVQRYDAGFDPQQLVAWYRITTGVTDVPMHVATARLLDELLDTHTLLNQPGQLGKVKARAERGMSSRSAQILNDLLRLQPALLSEGVQLAWTGPAVVLESVSLRRLGHALKTVARIDIWRQALAPRATSTRAQRAEWGLATLAVEGHLLETESVSTTLLEAKGPLTLVSKQEAARRLKGDEIAQQVHAEGGLVLSSTTTSGRTWSLRPTGDLLGTLTTRGTAAKGGERMDDSVAAGVGGVMGGIAGAAGHPAGMLVGGIAAYLNELRKAWGGATNVMIAVGKTIETGDDRYVLEALGRYQSDIGRRLARALAEGIVRGYAESVIGAAGRPLLGSTGNVLGDRVLDGAVAGGLAAPQNLPVVSDVVEAAGDVIFGR